MDYETIRMEMPEPGIGLITLNRSDQLNAWTKKMMEELIDTFCQADENDDIRVTIITGEGKGFCA
ncbi:MAG: enoyl-CoA hydratase/isomerase family protein, partial [Deltaproteobacteria bacterium]|nr:enoyl-CoA hydratase/isomerase family protein [Deltaproteobacteria bacterium]